MFSTLANRGAAKERQNEYDDTSHHYYCDTRDRRRWLVRTGTLVLGCLNCQVTPDLRFDDADRTFTDAVLYVEDVLDGASKRSAQRCPPPDASTSWAVIRSHRPARRTLPSST
jgi:hypothetical protein